jgi:hypothetical protein
MEYLITRVSPGTRLSLSITSSHELSSKQLSLEAEAEIRSYYSKKETRIIPEFCHAFCNVDPMYAIIITAIETGYGIGIVDYEAFIVKQK